MDSFSVIEEEQDSEVDSITKRGRTFVPLVGRKLMYIIVYRCTCMSVSKLHVCLYVYVHEEEVDLIRDCEICKSFIL